MHDVLYDLSAPLTDFEQDNYNRSSAPHVHDFPHMPGDERGTARRSHDRLLAALEVEHPEGGNRDWFVEENIADNLGLQYKDTELCASS